MCKDVQSYVELCHVCALSKAIHTKPAGLLHPLLIPQRPWYSISMDFIVDLLPVDGKDSILAIVDCISKMAYFIACSKFITLALLADLFFYHIIQLYGFPNIILSNQGSIFVLQFWSILLKNCGILQNLSSVYRPQFDRQTERE